LNAQATEEDWVYTTRPGDTLWNITKDYLKDMTFWPRLQKYNNIINPKLLPPGSRLLIPVAWLKQQPKPASVIAVNGIAHVKLANKPQLIPLKIGMKINISSEIITEDTGRVVLEFADGSQLIIQKNTLVKLDRLTAHNSNGMVDTRMRVQKGRVETEVSPFKNKKSRFEITTPAAVASVRGTRFRVNIAPRSTAMLSEVTKGNVEVTSEGITQTVPAGFGIRVNKGEPPTAPQPLLAAADLSRLETTLSRLSLKFTWPPIIGAKKYHMEIAPTPHFYQLLFDQTSSTPSLEWNAQATGEFSLRVRGINSAGNEGFDAVHHFSIINEVPAPQLVYPPNKARIDKSDFVFQWRGHSDAEKFRLQVSSSKYFEQTVIEATGNQQYYSVQKKLAPGSYYWRVANIYPNNIVLNTSEIFHFNMTNQP
ncbi:MAG TPA: LysM peptidoglycan-binding domain-containing protein, partial [Gammaproteobacteria bacterium]|nr:LysM peptidoglycan-binding domain-containing protein [Gammaproteobacteria bacterium]